MDSAPYIFAWWVGFLLAGNITYILIEPYLGALVDRGYGIAKVVGIVGLTYIIWLLGSIGLVPFSSLTCALVLLAGAALAGWRYYKQKPERLWGRWAIVEEILFAGSIVVWSFVRSYNPRMEGVEKFMDAALLNSMLRSVHFPPLDPWYAGATVNYYYFGHLMVATMAKLTHVPVQYAFNLGLIGTFALVLVVTFSLVLTLAKLPVVAALSGFLLTLSCNLDPALNSMKQWLYPHFSVDWLKPVDNYIFFGATRLDPYTINEFPLYSFVVADLHAHTLGLPLTVTIMALLYVLFVSAKVSWPLVGLVALLLGATGPTNSFDLVMYAFLTGLVLLVKAYFDYPKSRKRAEQIVLSLLAIWAGALLLYLPFYLNFQAPVGGIGLDSIVTTPINYVISHLLYVLPGLGPIFQQHLPLLVGFDHKTWLATPIPFILDNFGILLFFSLPLIYIAVQRLSGREARQRDLLWGQLTKEQWFSLILIVFALLLIVAPEFVYLKDIYAIQNPPYSRANTIFKVYFQAWAVLAIAAGTGVAALRKIAWPRWAVSTFVFAGGVFIGLSLVGTVSAFQTMKDDKPTTINGYNYLATENPDQLALINWMNAHISGQPTIVEAAGESYTQRSRISSYTGLPEPIGWASHEWGWRYSPTEWGVISQRMGDVQQIYTTTDPNQLRNLLQKWHIQYIVASPVETEQYPSANFATIAAVAGKPVFQQGAYALYQVKE